METVNELIYTPKGERDYGTLACWGTNSIGKQVEPCLFQIVPAGKSNINIFGIDFLIRQGWIMEMKYFVTQNVIDLQLY